MGFALDMHSLNLNLVFARKGGKEPFRVFRGRAIQDARREGVFMGPPDWCPLPSGRVRTIYMITLGVDLGTLPGPTAMLCLVDNGHYYETHSYIEPHLRGQGLGVALYSAAIEVAKMRNLGIGSSNHPSEDALRLWESTRLRQTYDITRTGSGAYRVAI